jgi:RimJ/RimL family protein N-acetyltransferase
MQITTPRFLLRDFSETDRKAFTTYQMDARYRRLYDYTDADQERAEKLFDLFGVWRHQQPRQNFQVGVFERTGTRLCGCAGLRKAGQPLGTAIFGLELTPASWGRYGLAIEVASALMEYGFCTLGLHTIIGDSASGNVRVDRLARWFGAVIVSRREGSAWMTARGWKAVDWTLSFDSWKASPARRRFFRH